MLQKHRDRGIHHEAAPDEIDSTYRSLDLADGATLTIYLARHRMGFTPCSWSDRSEEEHFLERATRTTAL